MKTENLEDIIIKNEDILYKPLDMNLDGWVLLEKNSLVKLMKDNNDLKKRIQKLETKLYKSQKDNFSLKQAFKNCFSCLDRC